MERLERLGSANRYTKLFTESSLSFNSVGDVGELSDLTQAYIRKCQVYCVIVGECHEVPSAPPVAIKRSTLVCPQQLSSLPTKSITLFI